MANIVIVEDELIAAEYLKKILEKHGCTVLAVIDSGAKAIADIPRLKPDIVLMDIMLKDNVSGSEAALSLATTAPDIAIVFLTAFADREMVNYAMQSNTYGYLIKPYDEMQILTSLQIIVSKLNKDRSLSEIEQNIVHIDKTHHFDLHLKRFFEHNTEVSLGIKSLALLEILCKRPNITISVAQLSNKIWGEPKDASMLRTQISRTKKEMGIDVIQNVKGLGYKIVCTLTHV